MKTRLMMLALAVLTSATLFSCKKDDKEGDSNIILEKTAVTLNLGGQTTVKVTAPDGIKKPESEDVDVAIANMGRDINIIISSKKVGGKVGETRVKIESKTGDGVAYINVTVKDEMKTDRGIAVLGKTVFVDRDQEVEVTNLLKKYNGTIDKVNINSTSTALAKAYKKGNANFFVKGIGEGLTGEVYFEDTAGEKNDKGEFPQGSFIVHVRAPFTAAIQNVEIGIGGKPRRIDLNNIYNNSFTIGTYDSSIATIEYAKELVGADIEKENGKYTGVKIFGKKEGTLTVELTNSDGDNGKGNKLILTIAVRKSDDSNYIVKDGVLLGIKTGVKLKGNITLPPNITKVARRAFAGQNELTGIDFNNVTEIEGKLFNENETDLYSFDVNVSYIKFPKIKKIGDSSFRMARSLTKVEFPATLTHLGQNAFSNCTALQHVAFRGTVPPKGLGALPEGKDVPAPEIDNIRDVFSNGNGKIQLYIPLSSKADYDRVISESDFRAGGIYNPKDISEFK